MTPSQQMSIPKARSDTLIQLVMTIVIVLLSILAILNVFHGDALIPSICWLVIITRVLWGESKQAGGWGRFMARQLGNLFGRDFVEANSLAVPGAIRFGFELLGYQFIEEVISIAQIESIEWTPGQANQHGGS